MPKPYLTDNQLLEVPVISAIFLYKDDDSGKWKAVLKPVNVLNAIFFILFVSPAKKNLQFILIYIQNKLKGEERIF